MFLESGKDEHKELLAKVKEFTRKHELFFQAIPSYISVQDRDFRIIITNSLFQKDFGEQVGEKCYKVYKNRKEKCKDCPVEKTFRKGKTYSSEEIIVTDEGKEVNVIVYTSPIFGDDGTVTAVVEMMVNIDRIKKRQEKIENSMREYRNLFSSVPCYISIQDRNFRILKANKLLEDNFGDCINKFCYKVYKNREKKCENCPVEKTFKDGNVYNSEEVVLKRDDEPANVIVYTSPVRNREGKITSVMEMSTDITEVKRLQKELATLGMAMAGVTHSIKCILQGLDGAVYLIDSGLKKNNKERVTTGWKTIKNNIPKMTKLVKDILYVSKEREPDYKKVTIKSIFDDIFDLFEDRAKASGIEFVKNYQNCDIEMTLDPEGIHTVLSNLISNAIDSFQKAKRKKHRKIEMNCSLKEQGIVFDVTDNSCGMKKDEYNKLFRDFLYSTKGSQGTGMGLMITKKIVEEHKGKINVETKAGKGSKFIITIPLNP